jgi:proline dehydrogenase
MIECSAACSWCFPASRGFVTGWKTSPAAHRLTSRFVAGSTLEREVAVCTQLNAGGYLATLDHLGESVTSLEEAQQSRDAYLAALDQIAKLNLQATVSVKLTQLGLDFSETACRANVECLVARAKSMAATVEVDMESGVYVDRTLTLVSDLHARCGSVRAVIQAYLRRSESDIRDPVPAIDSHPIMQGRLSRIVGCGLPAQERRGCQLRAFDVRNVRSWNLSCHCDTR